MSFYNHFQDKTAIVTGAASGIGKEITIQLLQSGAKVMATDINEEGLHDLIKTVPSSGQLEIAQLDVVDRETYELLIEGFKERHGVLDYIFNNAGIAVFGEVQSMSTSQWDKIIDVNIKGVVNGTHAAYKIMCEQGHGHIVNTASGAGLMPIPLMTAYCMTKHAVVGLSTSLREEAKRYNVKVSAICPGVIGTNIFKATDSNDFDVVAMHKKAPIKELPVEHAVNTILKEVIENQATIVFPRSIKISTRSYALAPKLYSKISQLGMGKVLDRIPSRMRKKV